MASFQFTSNYGENIAPPSYDEVVNTCQSKKSVSSAQGCTRQQTPKASTYITSRQIQPEKAEQEEGESSDEDMWLTEEEDNESDDQTDSSQDDYSDSPLVSSKRWSFVHWARFFYHFVEPGALIPFCQASD